jgi:hypothetical protein
MRKFLCLFVFVFLVMSLNACSGAKKMLGLTRTAPDEFTVLTRAPLSLPPDYELKPPKPGAKRPQDGDSSKIAKRALFSNDMKNIYGDDSLYSSTDKNIIGMENRTQGEVALLEKAGAESSIPNIRKIISTENTKLVQSSKKFTDKIIFWQEKEHPTAILVDAEKEAKRIQENKALGKKITQGETPVIKRKGRGFLEGIF